MRIIWMRKEVFILSKHNRLCTAMELITLLVSNWVSLDIVCRRSLDKKGENFYRIERGRIRFFFKEKFSVTFFALWYLLMTDIRQI